MTIQWTDAAIEAADRAYQRNIEIVDSFEFWRTVLDAAVAAQGMTAGWINQAVDDAYQEGRADALDEAAKWFDEQGYVAGARDLRFLKENSDA